MSEFLEMLFRALLFVLYLFLFPVILLVCTPFILLWPGKRQADGTRRPKDIKARYLKVLRAYKSIGLGVAALPI